MAENNPKNIVFVFNSLEFGGIERKIVDLTNHFSSLPGLRPIILLKHHQGSLAGFLNPSVVIAAASHRPGLFSSLLFPYWLNRQFRTLHPALVISFGNYSSVAAVMARLFCRRHFPLVISEDSSITTQIKTDSYSPVRLLFVRLFYPLADRIIVLTAIGRKKLITLIPSAKNRTFILKNWLSPGSLCRDSNPAAARDTDIVFLGRFVPQKNPVLFLKICRHLLLKQPKLRISMYGQGSELPKMKQYLKRHRMAGRIALFPPTPNPGSVFCRSKILLLTSSHEGFPLTILEALANGCLPVCRRLEEIEPFFNLDPGRLIYQTSGEAVAKIIYLLHHPSSSSRLLSYYQQRTLQNQQADFGAAVSFLLSLV